MFFTLFLFFLVLHNFFCTSYFKFLVLIEVSLLLICLSIGLAANHFWVLLPLLGLAASESACGLAVSVCLARYKGSVTFSL